MEDIIEKLFALGVFIFLLYIATYLFEILDKRNKAKADKSRQNDRPSEKVNVDTYTEYEYAEDYYANTTRRSQGRFYNDPQSKELFSLIDELIKVFKIKKPVNDYQIRQHFNSRDFAACVSEMKKQMGLTNRIVLRCYSDEKYPRSNSYGFIEIPSNIPLINTPAFHNFKMVVSIKESTKTSYETFIYTIAHELSHALLHSMRHSLKESEEATDLLVIVLGFGNIMKKGIRDERKAGHYAKDGFTQFTSSHSTICGYLGETNFEFVYKYIGEQYLKSYINS